MKINTSFNKFKKNHRNKKHQIIFSSRNCKTYNKIDNLYKFILAKKNSFILRDTNVAIFHLDLLHY